MRNRLITGLVALVAVAAVSAQTKYAPPRLADGHPDLQGTYDLATLTPLERPSASKAVLTAEEAAQLEAKIAAQTEAGRRSISAERTAPPKGGDGSIGAAGAVRNLYLKDPGPAPVDSWMGQSVARWDKDTLVVDVTNLSDQTWFDRAGNFHSDALHVVERYTRTAPDVITYSATIEDRNIFSRPWTIEVLLYRHLEKNFRLMEYECQMFKEKLVREGKGNNLRVVENN